MPVLIPPDAEIGVIYKFKGRSLVKLTALEHIVIGQYVTVNLVENTCRLADATKDSTFHGIALESAKKDQYIEISLR